MNSKQKGNRFERECAAILRRELWPECYTSRFMGSAWLDYQGVDLTGTGSFYVQCKNAERLPKSYHDILAGMPKNGKTNLILHKRNNSGIVAVMSLEDFLQLMKKKGE